MKISTILLFAASSVLAAPVFWGHPNVQVSLDAPQLPFGQVIDIDLADLIIQNPQNQIWFTGGLVGYFANEWKAPIWTVPWLDERLNPRERETPVFYFYDPPSVSSIPVTDPPDPERVIIHPYIPPPGPSPTDNPPPGPPPPGIELPDPEPDPNAVIHAPEPNLAAILAVLLATVFIGRIRPGRRY